MLKREKKRGKGGERGGSNGKDREKGTKARRGEKWYGN